MDDIDIDLPEVDLDTLNKMMEEYEKQIWMLTVETQRELAKEAGKDKVLEQLKDTVEPTAATRSDDPREASNATRQEEYKKLPNFHGSINKAEAEKRLRQSPGPAWLVRHDAEAKQMVISTKWPTGDCVHMNTINSFGNSTSADGMAKVLNRTYGMAKVTAKAGAAAPPDAGAQPKVDNKLKDQCAARIKELTAKGKLAATNGTLPSGSDHAKEVLSQMQAALQAQKQMDYGRALSRLNLAERLLDEGPPKDPTVKELQAAARKAKTKADDVNTRLNDVDPMRGIIWFEGAVGDIQNEIDYAGSRPQALAEGIAALEHLTKLGEAAIGNAEWEQKAKGKLKSYTLPPPSPDTSLGAGGYGDVCLLQNPDTDAPQLAIKLAKDASTADSLQKEADAYQAIGDHPNIARCLGMQTIDGKKGLVMEKIGGGDVQKGMKKLADKLKKGEIKQEQYWGMMQFTLARSLEALAHMADKGLVHADIKPQNIMYDDVTGEVKMIDMGMTKEEGKAWGGSYGYAAPEGTESKGVHETDVLGIGGVAYKAGEGKEFQHNRPAEVAAAFAGGDDWDAYFAAVQEYGATDEQALYGDDPLHPASKPIDDATRTAQGIADPGARKKEAGIHGANTEYVKFVNWLMDPDPTKRPTARQALEHPFLKDPLVSDDEAKELVQNLNKPAATTT